MITIIINIHIQVLLVYPCAWVLGVCPEINLKCRLLLWLQKLNWRICVRIFDWDVDCCLDCMKWLSVWLLKFYEEFMSWFWTSGDFVCLSRICLNCGLLEWLQMLYCRICAWILLLDFCNVIVCLNLELWF